jgi:hypothetical protein
MRANLKMQLHKHNGYGKNDGSSALLPRSIITILIFTPAYSSNINRNGMKYHQFNRFVSLN